MTTVFFHKCLKAVGVILLFGLISWSSFAADESSEAGVKAIELGSVAMDIPAEMVRRLTPLTDYLTKETGLKVNFHAAANLGNAVDDLGNNTTQIAYFTPVAYLEAHEKYKAQILVSPLVNGKPSFKLVVGVKKDSPYKKLKDLKGKKFAFGDKKAKLQPAVIVHAGFPLSDFASFDYLNHYDNIAKAVLNGDFDAGILKDSTAEKFAADGIRAIYSSPALASYNFTVNKNLPKNVVKKLQNALVKLNNKTSEGKAILENLESGYEGFTPVKDKDYEPIRKILKAAKAAEAKANAAKATENIAEEKK